MLKTVIMSIEDSEEVSVLLQRILSSQGWDVIPVFYSDEAYQRIKDTPPHLILLDIMMPVVDGFKILNLVKNTDYIKDIPVVMLSSINDMEKIKRALREGANDYIVKPINAATILQKIKKHLKAQNVNEIKVLAQDIPETGKKCVVDSEIRIDSLGEQGIKLESNYFFAEHCEFSFRGKIFKEIGIEPPKLKIYTNTLNSSPNSKFKFKNEGMFVDLPEKDQNLIKAWLKK